MKDIALEGELLDYFNQFVKWVEMNTRIDNSHLERLKDRAINELRNDSQKWYFEKDFSDLFNYCVLKTARRM
jgi:hypothetical protein